MPSPTRGAFPWRCDLRASPAARCQPATTISTMPNHALDGPRLARISSLCAALPETTCTLHCDYVDFRVRKKPFAYYLHNHHNDGIVSVCCKSEMGENVDRVAREPKLYYLPRYIGKQGWFAMRLDQGAIAWRQVENAIELSYCIAAPKKLSSIVMDRNAQPIQSEPSLSGAE